jgi:type IV pilus assembly protein PilN
MKDINLIPDEQKTNPVLKADAEKRSISVKSIIIAVIVLAAAVTGIISPRLYVRTLENEAVAIQNEVNSDKYAEVKRINAEINAAQNEISSKNAIIEDISRKTEQISELINYVEGTAPIGLSVNAIQYSNGKMNISGLSKDSTAVAEYIANLTRVNLLTNYTANASFSYGKANSNLAYNLEFTKSRQED